MNGNRRRALPPLVRLKFMRRVRFVGAYLLCWCTWDKCTPYKYTLTYNLKEK